MDATAVQTLHDAIQNAATMQERQDRIIDTIGVVDDEVRKNAAAIAGKVDAVAGKGLSTNDYTAEDKARVNAIVVTVDDALDRNSTNPVQNKVVYDEMITKYLHLGWVCACEFIGLDTSNKFSGSAGGHVYKAELTDTYGIATYGANYAECWVVKYTDYTRSRTISLNGVDYVVFGNSLYFNGVDTQDEYGNSEYGVWYDANNPFYVYVGSKYDTVSDTGLKGYAITKREGAGDSIAYNLLMQKINDAFAQLVTKVAGIEAGAQKTLLVNGQTTGAHVFLPFMTETTCVHLVFLVTPTDASLGFYLGVYEGQLRGVYHTTCIARNGINVTASNNVGSIAIQDDNGNTITSFNIKVYV